MSHFVIDFISDIISRCALIPFLRHIALMINHNDALYGEKETRSKLWIQYNNNNHSLRARIKVQSYVIQLSFHTIITYALNTHVCACFALRGLLGYSVKKCILRTDGKYLKIYFRHFDVKNIYTISHVKENVIKNIFIYTISLWIENKLSISIFHKKYLLHLVLHNSQRLDLKHKTHIRF